MPYVSIILVQNIAAVLVFIISNLLLTNTFARNGEIVYCENDNTLRENRQSEWLTNSQIVEKNIISDVSVDSELQCIHRCILNEFCIYHFFEKAKIATRCELYGRIINVEDDKDVNMNIAWNMRKKLCKFNRKVHGRWSSWSNYSPCSASCGIGTKIRRRYCNSPEPQFGGDSCKGIKVDQPTCTLPTCPIHGGWSEWSGWSQCDVCSKRNRVRKCNSPSPRNGGKQCKGDDRNRKSCGSVIGISIGILCG